MFIRLCYISVIHLYLIGLLLAAELFFYLHKIFDLLALIDL